MVLHPLAALIMLTAVSALAQPPAPPAAPEPKTPVAAAGKPAAPPNGAAAQSPPPAAPALPAPPAPSPEPPAAKPTNEISLEDWDRADWTLVQPKTSLLQLKGYFRVRTDLLKRLDFGNGTVTEMSEGVKAPRFYTTDGSADFSTANMRLRLEPQINVTENIHIVSTFDVLDNLILGATPNAQFTTSNEPVNVLDQKQAAAERGVNWVNDAIIVRRLYARITALNEQLELRVGRMPSQWGLGMLSNSGDCLDCDFGDVVDRLALTFKIADLIFSPMYDWVSSGPVLNPYGRSGGQPIDAVPWDDVEQYSLRVMKLDAPATIRERVLAGQSVLNWGVWGIWRRQAREVDASFYQVNGTFDPTKVSVDPTNGAPNQQRRDSNILTGDAYLKLYAGGLELGLEGAAVYGHLDLYPSSNKETVSLLQFGGALEALYHFKGDYEGTTLSLKLGAASGDSSPGFGALDRTTTQFGNVGDQVLNSKLEKIADQYSTTLNNFQFSPDYHVDLLLFRHIIGTVTDAWYVRPEVSYLFSNNIGAKLAAIYSQAMYRRSTPSGSRHFVDRVINDDGTVTTRSRGPVGSLPLGLEIDGELSYGLLSPTQNAPLRLALQGGMLFPFAGFDNPENNNQSGSFAWTLQTRLYIVF